MTEKRKMRVNMKSPDGLSEYSCTVMAQDIPEAFELAIEHANNNLLSNIAWIPVEVEEDFI